MGGREGAAAWLGGRAMKYRVAFLSVVPSPYQRDIFAALARREEVDLRVDYLEAAAPDSPWPEKPLPEYSRILRGFWFSIGSARCHVNAPPEYRAFFLEEELNLFSRTEV